MKLSLPVKFALLSFVITLFGVIGVALIAYVESDQLLEQQAIDGRSLALAKALSTIEEQAQLVKHDVAFLARSDAMQTLLQHAASKQITMQDRRAVQGLFSTVLSWRSMYYQVRLIGLADAGREVVRVARLKQGITIVADDLLQHKATRDYFQKSIGLQAGEILFSDITFNREHGKITQPPQPMLRVSTAVYDDSGALFGILLINADFNVFMAALQQHYQGFLVATSDGDYVIHSDAHKAMAFEYNRQQRLQMDYPLDGKSLHHTFTTKNHLIQEYEFDDQALLLGRVYLDAGHHNHFLQVATVANLTQLHQKSALLRDWMLILTVMLAMLLGVVAFFFARYFIRPIEAMIDAAVKIGAGDENVHIPADTHDEMGVLGEALQGMVVRLGETRRKADALNSVLEVKVSKRTGELARLAAALESQNSALERAVSDAERAAAAKGQFLATMSHEIRTPLNGILGLSELILASKLYPEQRGRMEIVQSSGQALLTILNDILDFSKIEAGQMEMKSVDFNPNETIEHVANLFARQVNEDESNLELITRGIPLLPRLLLGDSDRLHQVMLNLLSNATKFTEQGEIVMSVEILSESETDACVRFQVADTGRGISDKDQQDLFEEFTQADGTDTRKHGGSGLGLAIVKRLVKMMGGTISVVSALGEGSRFFFDLRLQKSHAVDDGPHHYAEQFSQWHALVVDDHACNRTMLQDTLVAWGLSCDTATDGKAGLQALQAMAATDQPFDMVLIDQQMQGSGGTGLGGMELATWIKQDVRLADLNVILTTTLDMTFDAALLDEYGLNGFMRKPVYVHSLFETTLHVMGMRQRKARHVSILSVQSRSERILLVEDNAVNQQVALGLLKNQGFEHVDVANDGVEALACIAGQRYALVLMDIQMPVMDGIEATREIRQREQASHAAAVPIIALTAHALDEDKQRTQDAGMHDHLMKPLTGKTLAAMLAIWLPAESDHRDMIEHEGVIAEDGIEGDLIDSVGVEANIIDVSALRQLRTDMGFGIGMILDTYMDELPGQMDQLLVAVEAGDGDALRRCGHRLKGSSRTVSANALGDLCFRFEQLGSSGQAEDIEAAAVLIADLKQLGERVLEALASHDLDDVR